MTTSRVLIVEDEPLVALDIECALVDAGWDVCGIATSQDEALSLSRSIRPPFAVVDVRLSPGDGRVVARELFKRYGTAVLLATAHCEDIDALTRTGALACLPKPFPADDVPEALEALQELMQGRRVRRLPDHMVALGSGAAR